MGAFGGRRVVTRVSALLVLSVPVATAGCSAALDQAHSVQTKLGRIGEIGDASVSTPSRDTGAAIRIDYADATTVRELSRLIAAIDQVADEEEYPSYRLELAPAGSDGDRLVVDDTFVGSDDEQSVLANWFAVTAALLGDVTYTYEPGNESIAVDAGAGVAHDVGEASRVGYGFPETTWIFQNDGTAFVTAGRVSATDVTLFQGVQRTVSSEVLPTPAPTWRLERHDDHVVLDLDVAFPGGPVPPERLTIGRYGDDVERLVVAALDAMRPASLPVWLRLHHASATDDDLFGYWVSDRRPVRGRDRLVRGWDRWMYLLGRARAH